MSTIIRGNYLIIQSWLKNNPIETNEIQVKDCKYISITYCICMNIRQIGRGAINRYDLHPSDHYPKQKYSCAKLQELSWNQERVLKPEISFFYFFPKIDFIRMLPILRSIPFLVVGMPVVRAKFCFVWVMPKNRFHEKVNPRMIVSFKYLEYSKLWNGYDNKPINKMNC